MNKTRTRLIDPPHGDFTQKPSRYKVPLTQRTQKRPGRQAFPKPARVRMGDYLDFIREQPCRVCKVHPAPANHGWGTHTEAAHVDVDGRKGLGTKVPDLWTLPLCGYHHRSDEGGLDKIGLLDFQTRYGLHAFKEMLILHAEFWGA